MKFIHYQFNILTQMYNHQHNYTIFKLCHHLQNFPCAHLKIVDSHILLQNSLEFAGYFYLLLLNLLPFIRVLVLFKIKIILWFSFVLLLSDLGTD